jgi:hypothetical protein
MPGTDDGASSVGACIHAGAHAGCNQAEANETTMSIAEAVVTAAHAMRYHIRGTDSPPSMPGTDDGGSSVGACVHAGAHAGFKQAEALSAVICLNGGNYRHVEQVAHPLSCTVYI